MKKLKFNLLSLALLLLAQLLYSQEENVSYYRSVTLVPQYLFINGVRIDYERKLTERHWLLLCPQVYLRENSGGSVTSSYDRLVGAGITLYDKIYLDPENQKGHGLYFSYGAGYNFFSMENDKNTTTINAINGDAIIGTQQVFGGRILLDIYMGLGHRYSFREFSDTDITLKYNNSFADFGYSGNRLLMGLKIGFLF